LASPNHFMVVAECTTESAHHTASAGSEAIREGLRLLEKRELKLAVLRQGLKDGKASGMAKYSLHGLLEECS
jgi:putative addiction module CopG family antidote